MVTLGGWALVLSHKALAPGQGDGWEASGFPQFQPHTINLYSRHVLAQARGQTDNNQVGLSLLPWHLEP